MGDAVGTDVVGIAVVGVIVGLEVVVVVSSTSLGLIV